MDQNKLDDFVANAALLAAHLSKQCDKASAELQHTAADFRQGVADGQAELAAGAKAAVRESLATEIPQAIHALGESTERFRKMADHLQAQQDSLERRARFLGWKSLASLAVAAVALAAGTGYFAWSNVQRAQKAQVQAEVLRALQQVTITSCDGQPCIKLEDGLRRWSKNDEYVLVDATSPSNDADAAP